MRLNMKTAREKKGLTHDEVAKQIGITRATYTNIENGNKNPSLIVGINIKKVLNYYDDDIFLNSECLNGTNSEQAS